MTLKELYDKIGGNYEEALSRLQMDKLIQKFVVKFLDDESCNKLFAAWEAGDEQAAFEAAHAAKGVCANLSLTALQEPASDITEALRPGNDTLRAATDIDARLADLRAAYDLAIDSIRAFAEEQ